jgi:uncharacterized cupin superfamily protein
LIGHCQPAFPQAYHVHRVQEETFYVLEGECEWQGGGQLVRARPGTYLFIPPGVPHNIGNASDKPARMLMTVSPPGHEHYFEELAKVAARGGPPDANAIAELRNRYDTDQLSALKISQRGPAGVSPALNCLGRMRPPLPR